MSVVNFLCLFFLGWPAMILGYLFGAIRSGWLTGLFFHDLHEGEAIARDEARKSKREMP